MRVAVEHPDGSRTVYFGISDYQPTLGTAKQRIELWFHREVEVDEQNRFVDGRVASAASETSYNDEGAYETIGDNAVQEDTEVIVGVTDRYPSVAFAARKLAREEDFEGDLTLHDPKSAP